MQTVYMIGCGIKRLIKQIRSSGDSKILLISPIHLANGVGEPDFDPAFDEKSVELSQKLKQTYSEIAESEHCLFLAASDFAEPSTYDREHLDENGHLALAQAIFDILYNDFSK